MKTLQEHLTESLVTEKQDNFSAFTKYLANKFNADIDFVTSYQGDLAFKSDKDLDHSEVEKLLKTDFGITAEVAIDKTGHYWELFISLSKPHQDLGKLKQASFLDIS